MTTLTITIDDEFAARLQAFAKIDNTEPGTVLLTLARQAADSRPIPVPAHTNGANPGANGSGVGGATANGAGLPAPPAPDTDAPRLTAIQEAKLKWGAHPEEEVFRRIYAKAQAMHHLPDDWPNDPKYALSDEEYAKFEAELEQKPLEEWLPDYDPNDRNPNHPDGLWI